MLIYKVTNLINNKIYIGKTKKSLEIRKRSHIKRMQSPKGKPLFFQRALKKYGLDNFKWEVLLEGCMSDEELCEKERYYIKFYNSNNRKNGYNLTEGGDGVRRKGWKHYEKTKLKIGKANKGLKRTPEQKQIIKLATIKAMKKYVFTSKQLEKRVANRNIRKNSLSLKILNLLKNKSIKTISEILTELKNIGVVIKAYSRVEVCMSRLNSSKRVKRLKKHRYKITSKGIKALHRLLKNSKTEGELK